MVHVVLVAVKDAIQVSVRIGALTRLFISLVAAYCFLHGIGKNNDDNNDNDDDDDDSADRMTISESLSEYNALTTQYKYMKP
ncbi:hypothetical protein CKAN_00404400 [Cinnamomum micranthum f. kanehirae]|uniref:Uncharacterized protein n=1 Tax=Cinnamomum micranthum f. kanehirae TaxID=337451 RepID=A0A443NAV6_9MAGN|nr:hypothetical protein CKAN_00404400 [Cinnamomum micranthum f. kanehirae]